MSEKDIDFDYHYPADALSRWNAALASTRSTLLAENVETSCLRYQNNGADLPVSINNKEYSSSYVVSLYTSFIGCTIEKMGEADSGILRSAGRLLLQAAGSVLKLARINTIVWINNRLLSTNLYPLLESSAVSEVTSAFIRSHPRHFLVWRSLNWKANGTLLRDLRAAGYVLLPIRQVLIWDPEKKFWKRRDSKTDFKTLANSPLQIVSHGQFDLSDMGRLKALYDLLYLEKHHSMNAKFTEAFFERAWRERWLTFVGLRDPVSGELMAWAGYYMVNGVMTTPVLGYDTHRPQEDGLYRQLTAILMQVSQRSGWLCHASSGVAKFKITRGALPEIEYYAVYMRHLPLYRRAIIRLLQAPSYPFNHLMMKHLNSQVSS